jgi:uncharacterized protein
LIVQKSYSRRKIIKMAIALVASLFLIDSLWVELFFIETNEFFLGKPNQQAKSLKIIQISDLHLRSISWQLRNLCHTINTIQPDLIVFTGDSIDRKKYLPCLDNFLALLDIKIQKAAIVGNWEYWSEVKFENLEIVYKKYNCDLIINHSLPYFIKGRSILVTGIDDYLVGCPDIKYALKDYEKCDFHLILNHCPRYNDEICRFLKDKIKVDLILSGHTHGGQVNLFGFRPYLPKGSGNYIKGWYTEENQKIYVSKGIGTSMFPARFMSRSEIAIFNLA